MALTEFGKWLRKKRIDLDVTLNEMAQMLNVSAAYLSSVETGKRKINARMIEKLIDVLGLSGDEAVDFHVMALEMNGELKISLEGMGQDDIRKIVLMLRRDWYGR